MEIGSDENQDKNDSTSAFEGLIAFVNPDLNINQRKAGAEVLRQIFEEYPEHPWTEDIFAEATQRLRVAMHG